MIQKRLLGDREGVAGAIATMFILLIVLSFINLYMIGYVPAYMKTQEYNHMQQLYGEFSAFQIQNYNLESGKWHYPLTSTFVLGTQGSAPFASPTNGNLIFSPNSFSVNLSYQLGLPLVMPQPNLVFFEIASGSAQSGPPGPPGPGGGGIGIHLTFLQSPNNTAYMINNNNQYQKNTTIWTPGNWIGYVPKDTVALVYINGSYINSDDLDYFIGNPGGPLNNFTLITEVYGSHNIMDYVAYGSNLNIWYISYGNYNTFADNSNPCGFTFYGTNDHGYVQQYGIGDVAPYGWPQFKTVQEFSAVSGSISAQIFNNYYTPQTVAYQGGAVLVGQGKTGYILNGPQFAALNASRTGALIRLNLVSLVGNNFTASGNGPVSLSSTYFSNSSLLETQYNGLNRINLLNLTIHSSYASAWAAYFQKELSGLQNVTKDPQIALVGNGCVDMSKPPVTWGAYSITLNGDTLQLSIFNVATLNLQIGYLQTAED
jgi:hypothetical protein